MNTPYRQPPRFPRIGRALPWRVPSLIAVALLSTLAWRHELYAHGWPGLEWVTYFHRAIPLGVALWIVWAVVAARVPTMRHRVGLGLGLVALAVPLYYAVGMACMGVFSRWGGGLDAVTATLWMLPPFVIALLGAVVGARTSWLHRAAGVLLWAAALPLGVLWLGVSAPHFADALHAIKTGAAIPWLVLALGLPLLPSVR